MIMAGKIKNNNYMTGEAVPPGETIKDNMILLGLQTVDGTEYSNSAASGSIIQHGCWSKRETRCCFFM